MLLDLVSGQSLVIIDFVSTLSMASQDLSWQNHDTIMQDKNRLDKIRLEEIREDEINLKYLPP